LGFKLAPFCDHLPFSLYNPSLSVSAARYIDKTLV
jgi:hypothetical protein